MLSPQTTPAAVTKTPDWNDAAAWRFSVSGTDINPVWRPYTGNGLMGLNWGELLVFSESDIPLLALSKIIFDAGCQIPLPQWHRLEMTVGGVPYRLSQGRHNASHHMDLRSGEITLADCWEFRPGEQVNIRATIVAYRNARHGAGLRLEISGTDAPIQVRFGLSGAHLLDHYAMSFRTLGSNRLLGQYTTRQDGKHVCQGLIWSASGWEVITANADEGSICANTKPAKGRYSIEIFHAFHTDSSAENPREAVKQELTSLRQKGWTTLSKENLAAWKPLWANALDLSSLDPVLAQDMRLHQFYLLASLDEYSAPLGALGLSHLGWRGNTLWDADLWIFRAILPMWPQFARALLHFRFQTLQAARDNATRLGYSGACYPWSAGDDGAEYSASVYHRQHHVNIWIAMGFIEYYRHGGDIDFFRSEGWPVIRDIADFWVSRMSVGEDGLLHLMDVLGPDEAVAESGPGSCNDHYLTNLGAYHMLGWATQAATDLKLKANPEWEKARKRLYIPAPEESGIIPEFSGYRGELIKQADVILAFYLLEHGLDAQAVQTNVDYYHWKIQHTGPLMNSQIEACIAFNEKRLPKDEILTKLLAEYEPFIRGPYRQTFECLPRTNQKAVFLTAPAGLLQALIYGYYDQQIGKTRQFPVFADSWQED